MYHSNRAFLWLLLAGLLIPSCVPIREMVYVQSPPGTPSHQMVYQAELADTRIRPGDEIYVRISSADEGPTGFTPERGGVYDPTFYSYTLNEEGSIKLPYIGSIQLSGLTLEQATDTIENTLSQFLFMPNVYLRFVNTKVTVLGEVNRPGVYVFNEKNINIFQALGYASDIAEFGDRQRVMIIREQGTQKTKHFVDLTREDILKSEWYILQSDDIIYVQPLGRKRWGMTTVPYNLVLTIISTGLFVYTVLNSN